MSQDDRPVVTLVLTTETSEFGVFRMDLLRKPEGALSAKSEAPANAGYSFKDKPSLDKT